MVTNNQVDPGSGKDLNAANWTQTNNPAAATQATVSQPAAGAGIRNVLKSLAVSVAAGATAQTPITAVVRDGAAGIGPIIWVAVLSAPVNQSQAVYPSDLNIPGSPNTPMTVEFTAAGVAGSLEAVSMSGYYSIK